MRCGADPGRRVTTRGGCGQSGCTVQKDQASLAEPPFSRFFFFPLLHQFIIERKGIKGWHFSLK